jgi:high-affinity Fe2+/Pb2+ permease
MSRRGFVVVLRVERFTLIVIVAVMLHGGCMLDSRGRWDRMTMSEGEAVPSKQMDG